MGYNNKEIEKKYVIIGETIRSAFYKLKTSLASVDTIVGESTDHYWHVPDNLKSTSDFMRVRTHSQNIGELTLKKARGSNVNRIEIDLITDPRQAKALMNQLLGKQAGHISKKYRVLIMDRVDTTISVYQIRGDERIFLEVEARTLKKVDSLVSEIEKILNIQYEPKSLYQLFLSEELCA